MLASIWSTHRAATPLVYRLLHKQIAHSRFLCEVKVSVKPSANMADEKYRGKEILFFFQVARLTHDLFVSLGTFSFN